MRDKNHKAESQLLKIIASSHGVFNTGLWIRPSNARQEEEKFINAQLKGGKYNPVFKYPPVHHTLAVYKKDLSQIEIDTGDSWGKILQRTRRFLINKLDLLKARDTEDFSRLSLKVFAEPGHSLLIKAHQVLEPFTSLPPGHQKPYTVKQAASILKTILNEQGFNNWQVKFNHQLALAEIAMHSRTLWLNEHPVVPYTRHIIMLLTAHEIKTHIRRYENGLLNGKKTGHPLIAVGTGGFIVLEEGLAYHHEQQMRMRPTKTNTYALRLIALQAARRLSFQKTYDYLLELNNKHKLQLEPLEMTNLVARVKRGLRDTSKKGAYTKDWSYFGGYQQVKKYLAAKGQLSDLFIGKISLTDVPIVKEMLELRRQDTRS